MIRVRIARRPDGTPGPWCQWVQTVGYGAQVALLVICPHPDGGLRVMRWPVVGQAIEVEGDGIIEVMPAEES